MGVRSCELMVNAVDSDGNSYKNCPDFFFSDLLWQALSSCLLAKSLWQKYHRATNQWPKKLHEDECLPQLVASVQYSSVPWHLGWGNWEKLYNRVVLSQVLELCNRFGHVWDSAQGCYDGAMQRRSVSYSRWAVKLENEWSRDVATVCTSINAFIS